MAFLEELGKTLADTGREVATKAKTLTGAIQLKAQISSEKAKLEEAYAIIGKKYYKSHPEPEEALENEYQAVQAGLKRIASLEEELCQAEGTRICAECGAKVPKDSAFCGKCGAAVAVAPPEAEDGCQAGGDAQEEDGAAVVGEPGKAAGEEGKEGTEEGSGDQGFKPTDEY